MTPIRVLIVDDHEVVRHGLRVFLELQEGLEVVGEAENGAQVVEAARAHPPDVVLMDLAMPGVDGVEATRRLRDACPDARVLVLSSFSDEERVVGALRAGVAGYLTKDTPPEEVAQAIRSVHAGDPVLAADALRRLTDHVVAGQRRPEGTVTILITDVEGSTALVERLGDDAARELLREHDAVVRRVAGAHEGLEVDNEGDSFMLAFSSARRAVRCALDLNDGLAGLPFRIRAGLNTGDVIAERDGYFGRAVFVASRVMSIAEGGEVLLTDVTRALAGETQGVRFVDRGQHELKGLSGRHRIYAATTSG
jgi:DNA-binding NarL/FixJ family response regulator